MFTPSFVSFAAVVRSPWLNQIGQGTQIEKLLTEKFGAPYVIEFPADRDNSEDFSCLLYPDGSPRFNVLVVPGGDDQMFIQSLASPKQAKQHLLAFVRQGGGYVGICAGMCIATHGYWDLEEWVPRDATVRREVFLNFMGLFPFEVENLHHIRRVTLQWNSELEKTHPMCGALTPPGLLQGARYNDGNALPQGYPNADAEGIEYLLKYSEEEPWDSDASYATRPIEDVGSLVGKWASIAYVDPTQPRAGRLVLDGWHPESVRTPQCHAWFHAAVEYASARTLDLEPIMQQLSEHALKPDCDECETIVVLGSGQKLYFAVNMDASSDCELHIEVVEHCEAKDELHGSLVTASVFTRSDCCEHASPEYERLECTLSKDESGVDDGNRQMWVVHNPPSGSAVVILANCSDFPPLAERRCMLKLGMISNNRD